MRIKHGVSLLGMQTQAHIGMSVIDSVLKEHFGVELVVTRGTEDSPGSVAKTLHKKGLAFDARKREIPEVDHARVVARCKSALGPEYDVTISPHNFHIEWDPK